MASEAGPNKIDVQGLTHQLALWKESRQDLEMAMVGPLGCGKTFGLAVKQAMLRAANKGTDGLLVVPSYPIARKVHFKDWPAVWARLGITVTHEKAANAWLWPWGDRTWIGTADVPESLVGPNLGDVTFDEPGLMAREAYDRGCARARHPSARVRQKVLGGTPEGINWFADLFASSDGVRRRTIWARSWHRDMAHYRGILMDLYGYDESLLAAYAGGKFVPLRVGRCYKPFDRAVHQASEPEYSDRLDLILACDFNVDSMRWEVAQRTGSELRFLDEIALGRGGSTEAAAKEFASRWGHHRGRLLVTGDASGEARSTSGRTDYAVLREELGEAGLDDATFLVPKANPRQKDRVDNMNYHLSGRGKGLRVSVSKRCRELALDWERVAWRKGQSSAPAIDKDSDALRTHASDAADYLAWMLARSVSEPSGSTVVTGGSTVFGGSASTKRY